jgi:signal transduction histidine kinase
MKPYRRTIKLILPRLQLKLIFVFVSLSALALLLQYLLLMSVLANVAAELPHDGLLLLDGLGAMMSRIFLISAGVLLPLTALVGVLVTHRFAGPIYRFQIFLRQLAKGERPRDCKLRKGDELQEFCDLLNQATASMRVKQDERADDLAPVAQLRAAG